LSQLPPKQFEVIRAIDATAQKEANLLGIGVYVRSARIAIRDLLILKILSQSRHQILQCMVYKLTPLGKIVARGLDRFEKSTVTKHRRGTTARVQ